MTIATKKGVLIMKGFDLVMKVKKFLKEVMLEIRANTQVTVEK
jgi:hypothetical protein